MTVSISTLRFGTILFSLVLLAAGLLPVTARGLSPEQTEQVRTDARKAAGAVDRVLKQGQNPDAGTAKEAIDRILVRLGPGLAADPFDNGKKYPPASKAKIESFEVPPNSTVIHVPVTLDKPSPNTVVAYVRVYDGQGGHANPDTTKAVFFRPGDPLTQSASFTVRDMAEGNTLKAVQPSVPDGGERAGGGIVITAKSGAVNEPLKPGREPFRFEPRGTQCYSVTGESIQFDDQGGPATFSTSLSHGRTQVGNGETGYYGTVDMNGYKRTAEGLLLSSRRLDSPMKVGSPAMEYPFLAVMLSGHKTSEAQFKYGSVEWVAKMPNRRGSWPALWLLPTAGWPPEIDVYEGFGYNGEWKFPSDLSTNLHGGDKLNRTFTRPAQRITMKSLGLTNTLDSEFHTHAVTVDPEWITMFVDGIETMRYTNPFKGENWYPLTNVAVKALPDSPYTGGSGDMTLRSLKVWRSE